MKTLSVLDVNLRLYRSSISILFYCHSIEAKKVYSDGDRKYRLRDFFINQVEHKKTRWQCDVQKKESILSLFLHKLHSSIHLRLRYCMIINYSDNSKFQKDCLRKYICKPLLLLTPKFVLRKKNILFHKKIKSID